MSATRTDLGIWPAAVNAALLGTDRTALTVPAGASTLGTACAGLMSGGNDAAAPAMVTGLRNSPNPFKPQTTIQYRLLGPADVSVQVYELNGRLVRTLVSAVRQPAGEQFLPWDGKDDAGELASGGMYFYRVWTPVETRTGKMVMVR